MTNTVTAQMRFTDIKEMNDAIYALVLEHKCVAINFTGVPVMAESTEELKQYAYANRDALFVNQTMSEGAEFEADLFAAFKGEGSLVNKVLVIGRDNRFKLPKFMVNYECSISKEAKEEMINKMLDILEGNLESFYAERLEADDKKQLKMALEKRARKDRRSSIYKGDRYTITALSIKKDFETNSWDCESNKITQNTGEIPRAFIEQYNSTFVEDKGRKIYDLQQIMQITFCNDFSSVFEMRHIWKKDDLFFYLPADQSEADDFEMESNSGKKSVKKLHYVCLTDKAITTTDITGAVMYKAVSHGASGARKLSSLYVAIDKFTEAALNIGSHGISNKLFGTMTAGLKVQNNVVRIMAGLTGSTLFAPYENIALFAGEFGIGKKFDAYKVLSAKGLDELKSTMDGIAFFTGFGSSQQRPCSAKVFAYGIPEITMNAMIGKYEQIVFDLTTQKGLAQAQLALDTLYGVNNNKELKASLENKILVFKKNPNKDRVDFYSDMNGFKTTWDLAEDFKVPVLDMPQRNHSGLSKQLINKMFAANPIATLELVKELGEEAIDDMINALSLERPLSIEDTKDMYLNMAVSKFAPEWANYDASIKESNVKLALNAFAKMVNKFKIPVKESANLRAIPDIGAYFGINILPEDVMFTKDIKAGSKAILIKYPTIGLKEFLEVTVWGMKQVKERIEELNFKNYNLVNDELKDALIGFYANIDEGCAIMPNSKRIMNLLAGMDFDYDMVIAFYDNRIVNIFKNTKPEMVDIVTTKPKKADVLFSLDAMFEPLANIIASKSSSVGAVTVEYDWFIQLYNMWVLRGLDNKLNDKSKQVFCTMLEAVLDTSFKDEKETMAYLKNKERVEIPSFEYVGQEVTPNGSLAGIPDVVRAQRVNAPAKSVARTTEYKGLETFNTDKTCGYVQITEDARTQVAIELTTCKVTPENFIKIVMDIVRIARYDQEVTIDSVKTSVFVKAIFNMNAFFGTFGRRAYDYSINKATGNIVRGERLATGDIAEINLKKVWHIYDIYAQLRDGFEAYFLPQIDAILKAPVKTEEVIGTAKFDSETKITNARNVAEDLFTIYNTVAIYMANNREDAAAKIASGKVYSAIRAIIRTMLEGSTIEDKIGTIGRLVYYIAACDKNGKVRDRKSNFNNTCFPLETLALAGGVTKKVARVAEKLYYTSHKLEEGSVVVFDNGNGYLEEDGEIVAVAENRINGDFIVQAIEDRKYKEVDGVLVEQDVELYATDDLTNHVDFNGYELEHALFTFPGEVKLDNGAEVLIGRVGSKNREVVIDGTVYKNHSDRVLSTQKSLMGASYVIADTIVVPANGEYDAKTVVIAKPVIKGEQTSVEAEENYEQELQSIESLVDSMSDEELQVMAEAGDTRDLDFTGFESAYVDYEY